MLNTKPHLLVELEKVGPSFLAKVFVVTLCLKVQRFLSRDELATHQNRPTLDLGQSWIA